MNAFRLPLTHLLLVHLGTGVPERQLHSHFAGARLARGREQGDGLVVGVEEVVRLAEHPRGRELLSGTGRDLELVALPGSYRAVSGHTNWRSRRAGARDA